MNKERDSNPIAARFVGPAPNSYALPSTFGPKYTDVTKRNAPVYSIGLKTWMTKSQSPGPIYGYHSQLTHKGMVISPKITMRGRPLVPAFFEGIKLTPAPGSYDVERITGLRDKSAPAFSIGARCRPLKQVTPPPNAYHLPGVTGCRMPHLKSPPFPSVYGRSEFGSHSYDFARTPGPANYKSANFSLNRKPPQFSFRKKTAQAKSKMDNPGPGAYETQPVGLHRSAAPKFSMGIRHSAYVMPFIVESLIDN